LRKRFETIRDIRTSKDLDMDRSKEVNSRKLHGMMKRKLGSSASKEESGTPCREEPSAIFRLKRG